MLAYSKNKEPKKTAAVKGSQINDSKRNELNIDVTGVHSEKKMNCREEFLCQQYLTQTS